jgi:hypothetical protein
MPVHQDKATGKWKWGEGHGEFETEGEARAQEAAAYASGWGGHKMEKMNEDEIAELFVLKSEEAALIKSLVLRTGGRSIKKKDPSSFVPIPQMTPGIEPAEPIKRTALGHMKMPAQEGSFIGKEDVPLDAEALINKAIDNLHLRKQEPEEKVGVSAEPDTSREGTNAPPDVATFDGVRVNGTIQTPSQPPGATKFGVIDPGVKLAKMSDDELYKLGQSIGINFNRYNFDEFKMGMKVETEHKDVTHGDPKETAKIAYAHLREVPDYYTKLKSVEKSVNHNSGASVRLSQIMKSDAPNETVREGGAVPPSKTRPAIADKSRLKIAPHPMTMTPAGQEATEFDVAKIKKSDIMSPIQPTNLQPQDPGRSSKAKEPVHPIEIIEPADEMEVAKAVNSVVDDLWDKMFKQDENYVRTFKFELGEIRKMKGDLTEEDFAQARRIAWLQKQELYSDEQRNILRRLGDDAKVVELTKDGDATIVHKGHRYVLRADGQIFAEDEMVHEKVIKQDSGAQEGLFKAGLVPKKISVTRGGKTFTQTVFVKPEATEGEAKIKLNPNQGGFKGTGGFEGDKPASIERKPYEPSRPIFTDQNYRGERRSIVSRINGAKTPEEKRNAEQDLSEFEETYGKPEERGGSEEPSKLSPEETGKVKVFENLKGQGHKTFDRNKAESLAREAADQLNSSTSKGYTVYGSTYHTYDAEGKETGHFAVVAAGSGETKGDLSRRAAKLREAGWKATPIDNEDIKGIVVTS